MKSRNVHLDTSTRQLRGPEAGPGIGKVPRVYSSDLLTEPKGRGRRGRLVSEARRKEIIIWSAALAVVTLVVLGGAVIFWVMPHMAKGRAQSVGGLENDPTVRIESKFPSPSEAESLELVKKALANRDPEEVPALFRTGSASAAEVVAFCEEIERRDGPVRNFEWKGSMDAKGLLMEGVLLTYDSTEPRAVRLAFLTPDAAGRWKLDFDSFARVVKPGWKELLDARTPGGAVRVWVAKDSYYNGPFADDNQWVSYKFLSQDVQVDLHGYCRVGSPVEETLSRMFPDQVLTSRATLEIQRVKDGEIYQFEIVRVLSEDWVVPDEVEGKR